MIKKCIVITTINNPTNSILKHIDNCDYDVIIVGDTKTPSSYKKLNCIFLDIQKQENLYPELSQLIPLNHYSRKNIGYLYAIQNSYDIIYETDDDTEPYNNFDYFTNYIKKYSFVSDSNKLWINYYKYFTNKFIWPRGYPLSQINRKDNLIESISNLKPSIICGLIDNDPDVDSIFRLIFTNKIIDWKKNNAIIIDNKNVCVFNTQNTFWVDKTILQCLLLPTSVSQRYCDILRSIIVNYIFRSIDKYIAISSPNAIQYRNYHNLIVDFSDEFDMFIKNETIQEQISTINTNNSIVPMIKSIYNNLCTHKIITQQDIAVLDTWLSETQNYI